MNAAEVEKSHVEIHGGTQVFERFAESEARSREAAKMRANAQVSAFNVARADMREIRMTADWDRNGGFYADSVVPLRASDVGLSINLDELREVHVRSERFLDCRNVPAKPVRRDLIASSGSLSQIADKFTGARRDALADVIGENHFRLSINRHPDVLIAPFFRSFVKEVLFLRVNESPKFIGLDKSRSDIADASIENLPALFSNGEKQGKNRGFVNARKTGYRTDAHAFEQKLHDLRGLFGRDVVASERLVARLRECRFAGGATVTLDAIAAESESLRFGMLAFDAGHVGFSLVFLREKPDNQLCGSECGLRPRLDSALPVAETTGRAFSFRGACNNGPNIIHRAGRRNRSKHHPCVTSLVARLNGLRLYLAFLSKASDDRVNRRHEVSVLSCIESQLLKASTHSSRLKRPIVSSESLPDCVRQSHFVSFFKRFIQDIGESDNHLSNGGNLFFKFLLLSDAHAHLVLKGKQLGLRSPQGIFKINTLRHNGGIRPCVQNEVK